MLDNSTDADVIRNLRSLLASPNPESLSLAKEIISGLYAVDNPHLHNKFNELYQLMQFIEKKYRGSGIITRIEMDQGGNFIPVVDSSESVWLGSDCVKNGKLIHKFGKVNGYFVCNDPILTSLEGFPEEVTSFFKLTNTGITSLVGGPVIVHRNYHCHFNKITNLVGAPEIVCGRFACNSNQLVSLDGAPREVKGDFHCYGNQVQFTEADVRAVCQVHGIIYV